MSKADELHQLKIDEYAKYLANKAYADIQYNIMMGHLEDPSAMQSNNVQEEDKNE